MRVDISPFIHESDLFSEFEEILRPHIATAADPQRSTGLCTAIKCSNRDRAMGLRCGFDFAYFGPLRRAQTSQPSNEFQSVSDWNFLRELNVKLEFEDGVQRV